MRKDGWFDIAIINTDGTEFRVITDGTGTNECPSWSSDGRFVIFSAKRERNVYDIYVASVETGEIKPLFKMEGNQKCPEWSSSVLRRSK